jgi:rod shape-determining protein MreC
MENLITRYRNVTILVAVLFAQILGLAVQVKRSTENESTRLIRIWAVDAISPLEKAIVRLQGGSSNLWHNYFYLRGVRQENRDLKQEIERLQIEQARLRQDAEQAHRLQLLLGFKEQFISKTVASQVIGSSGSEQSRSIYIDKGTRDGVKPDMAVITADGVVGKVLRVFKSTAQVLLINDQTSGVGAILEKTRLQGVLRGTPAGEVVLEKVMADESVEPGERVLTSGGDQIFPKGLPVGTVTKVSPGSELFLNIRVRPAADLSRLEEVLVVTQEEARAPSVAEPSPRERAADILAQRLPSIPDKPTIENPFAPPPPTNALKIAPAAGTATQSVPGAKPGGNSPTQNSGVISKPNAGSPIPEAPIAEKSKPTAPRAATQTGNIVSSPRSDSAGDGVRSITDLSTKPSTGSGTRQPSLAQKPAKPAGQISPSPENGNAPGSDAVATKPTSQPRQPTSEPSQQPAPPQDQPQ